MKYALVTGGSRGIGRAISIMLAKNGFYVIINYNKNQEEALNTLGKIKEFGGEAEILQFDVSSQEEVETQINKWKNEKDNRNIEVLVNNAGIRNDELLVFMKKSNWDSVINTNLNSFFNLTQLLIKDMIINKFGRIVNIVSVSGLKGLAGQTNYSASKAGVIAATKVLAQEVARKKITVNAVAPGYIKSDMTKDLNEKEIKNIIPMKRFGTPEEVANVVEFLVSEKSSYITGEVISINGGIF